MHQDAISGQSQAAPRFLTRLRSILLRKIWLPRSTYTALPYLYILLGLYAIVAALYLRHWSWIVPYLVMVGIGCVHAGAAVLSLRWRHRRKDSGRRPNLPE